MHIDQLRIQHFRNFDEVELKPSASFNLIHGLNGAGKSSLLEALHLLGFGRSFRTNKPNSIIQDSQRSATSFCRYNVDGQIQSIGASRHKEDGLTFSVDGRKSRKISEMARLLPMQIFTPQSSDLIIGPPLLRRRFIDWLLFHVEPNFHLQSARYNSALQQRNALLKQCYGQSENRFADQDVWQTIIAQSGEYISERRQHYLNALNCELNRLYAEFKPDVEIELRYNRGWDSSESLHSSLADKLTRDLNRGSTSAGPHKAEIVFYLNGKNASEFLSRGQLRVLVSLLLISEVRVLKSLTGKSCIFLVDDIAAELDELTREFFLDTVVNESAQVFVTAIDKNQLSFAEKYKNKKVFHVKQNHVYEE
uniref:DNA replication/repair protein RecF n=1 Tax=Ningiella ruwaisensis TaxID=2364274 RepID=UPI00109FFAEC|nr:DNA replication/repair protein RecF [Ningiella ruwaisensis]